MICQAHGISRQCYYKVRAGGWCRAAMDELIIQAAKDMRQSQPKIGVRKIHYLLLLQGLSIGRDRLFDLLRERGLLVRKKKRKYPTTTNSNHPFAIHANLIKDMEIEHPYQVLAADITYLETDNKWVYLSLVTDLYSRKILGWELSDSLEAASSLKALKMALKHCDSDMVIHHSDRGVQYCCKSYVSYLRKRGCWISMSAKGNPYENAVAERVNGILKTEFNLGEKFKGLEEARRAVKEAVTTYNEQRPHMALNYLFPEQVFQAAA